jgi:hypothetical protein
VTTLQNNRKLKVIIRIIELIHSRNETKELKGNKIPLKILENKKIITPLDIKLNTNQQIIEIKTKNIT